MLRTFSAPHGRAVYSETSWLTASKECLHIGIRFEFAAISLRKPFLDGQALVGL